MHFFYLNCLYKNPRELFPVHSLAHSLAFYLLTTRHLPDFATASADNHELQPKATPAPAPEHPCIFIARRPHPPGLAGWLAPPRMRDPQHPGASPSSSGQGRIWAGIWVLAQWTAGAGLKFSARLFTSLSAPALYCSLLACDSSVFINFACCLQYVCSPLFCFLFSLLIIVAVITLRDVTRTGILLFDRNFLTLFFIVVFFFFFLELAYFVFFFVNPTRHFGVSLVDFLFIFFLSLRERARKRSAIDKARSFTWLSYQFGKGMGFPQVRTYIFSTYYVYLN